MSPLKLCNVGLWLICMSLVGCDNIRASATSTHPAVQRYSKAPTITPVVATPVVTDYEMPSPKSTPAVPESRWSPSAFQDSSGVIKYPNNPLFVGIEPSVVKEGTEYWIYYNNINDIYRRVSFDETTWGPPSLVLNNGIYNDVVRVGSIYRMVYNSVDLQQVRLSISSNGVDFTDLGGILSVGASGEWDSELLADPCEIKVGSTYYLFYGGQDSTTGRFSIGLATSPTGLPGSYQKQGVVLNFESGFQSVSVFDADVLEDNLYKIYYRGDPGGQLPDHIGFVTIQQNPATGEPAVGQYP